MRKRRVTALATATMLAAFGLAAGPAQAAGPNRNWLGVPFTANGITSHYHLFSTGLDWSKPVGILMYADGSGAFGLDHPDDSYLLDAHGGHGLVAVARAHNLLLVTPIAPAPGCDREDNCWYNETGSPTPDAKADWASALMTALKRRYHADRGPTVIAGYSSGAQWATRWMLPRHGQEQSVALTVAIGFGGAPATTPRFTAGYAAKSVVSFDTGTADGAYSTAPWGALGGERAYKRAGFVTDMTAPPGVGHARDGQFASIVDREIRQHLTGPR